MAVGSFGSCITAFVVIMTYPFPDNYLCTLALTRSWYCIVETWSNSVSSVFGLDLSPTFRLLLTGHCGINSHDKDLIMLWWSKLDPNSKRTRHPGRHCTRAFD